MSCEIFCVLIFLLFQGAAVEVTMTCNEGHSEKWCSSQPIGSGRKAVYLINVLVIAYTFLCGINFEKIKVLY